MSPLRMTSPATAVQQKPECWINPDFSGGGAVNALKKQNKTHNMWSSCCEDVFFSPIWSLKKSRTTSSDNNFWRWRRIIKWIKHRKTPSDASGPQCGGRKDGRSNWHYFGSICRLSAAASGDKVKSMKRTSNKKPGQARKLWFPVYTSTVHQSFLKILQTFPKVLQNRTKLSWTDYVATWFQRLRPPLMSDFQVEFWEEEQSKFDASLLSIWVED